MKKQPHTRPVFSVKDIIMEAYCFAHKSLPNQHIKGAVISLERLHGGMKILYGHTKQLYTDRQLQTVGGLIEVLYSSFEKLFKDKIHNIAVSKVELISNDQLFLIWMAFVDALLVGARTGNEVLFNDKLVFSTRKIRKAQKKEYKTIEINIIRYIGDPLKR